MHSNRSAYQTEFFLVGFPFKPRLQAIVLVIFVMIYSMSLMGNLSIITAIWQDQRLHIPMYYLLSSLAFLDIWFISSTVPKLLAILATNNRVISLLGCVIQVYFYVSLGTTEFYLLAVMSVDRYVAICQPLRYTSIVTSSICLWMVLGAWIGGFLTFIYPIVLLFQLSFCGHYKINHFFCDSSTLMKMSCSDIRLIDLLSSIFASFVILGSLIVTSVSYYNILYTVMKVPSVNGKVKAFSTCTSHLTVVSLVYGSAIFLYVKPYESSSPNVNKVIALLNSVITPFLNPFIYCLRNKLVQEVLKHIVCKS